MQKTTTYYLMRILCKQSTEGHMNFSYMKRKLQSFQAYQREKD